MAIGSTIPGSIFEIEKGEIQTVRNILIFTAVNSLYCRMTIAYEFPAGTEVR